MLLIVTLLLLLKNHPEIHLMKGNDRTGIPITYHVFFIIFYPCPGQALEWQHCSIRSKCNILYNFVPHLDRYSIISKIFFIIYVLAINVSFSINHKTNV